MSQGCQNAAGFSMRDASGFGALGYHCAWEESARASIRPHGDTWRATDVNAPSEMAFIRPTQSVLHSCTCAACTDADAGLAKPKKG